MSNLMGQNAVLDRLPVETQKEIVQKTMAPTMWGAKKIAAWLDEEKGIPISHTAVARWLEKNKAAVTSDVYGSKAFQTRAGKMYAEATEEYYDALKRMTSMLKTVCNSRDLDILAKTKCATDLFKVITEGMNVLKSITVGEGGAAKSTLDMDEELDRMKGEYPVLQIVASKITEK